MNSETTEKERLYSEVLAALDKIRPYLEADGGDVKIVEISDDNVVMIELLGACGSCPMSTMTLKAGVEEDISRGFLHERGKGLNSRVSLRRSGRRLVVDYRGPRCQRRRDGLAFPKWFSLRTSIEFQIHKPF